jgi:hypothetical protein
MPPRYAFWTILIDGKPTAFRAREKEELLPTFQQLKRTNKDVVFKWFARGRLWETPEESQAALRAPRVEPEKRGGAWRPGGAHADPRDRTTPGPAKMRRDRRAARVRRRGPGGISRLARRGAIGRGATSRQAARPRAETGRGAISHRAAVRVATVRGARSPQAVHLHAAIGRGAASHQAAVREVIALGATRNLVARRRGPNLFPNRRLGPSRSRPSPIRQSVDSRLLR